VPETPNFAVSYISNIGSGIRKSLG